MVPSADDIATLLGYADSGWKAAVRRKIRSLLTCDSITPLVLLSEVRICAIWIQNEGRTTNLNALQSVSDCQLVIPEFVTKSKVMQNHGDDSVCNFVKWHRSEQQTLQLSSDPGFESHLLGKSFAGTVDSATQLGQSGHSLAAGQLRSHR